MFRQVISSICARQFGHEVLGETESGVTAVEMILRLKPDVVLLDLSLPDMDGFNVVDRVTAKLPSVRILVLSSHCDDYTLFRVDQTGVHGFLDKASNTVEMLRDALREVDAGRCYFSETFQRARLARRQDPNSFLKVLSEWERAILALIGQGLSDAEIATRLNIAPSTAQKHRSNLLRKLGVKNTPKLIAFAIEHGFTQIALKDGARPAFP